MNIKQYLKNYENICIRFEENQSESLKNRLISLGYKLPERFSCPVVINRSGRIHSVSGFCEGMLYSLSEKEFKKQKPNTLRIKYEELSPEETLSYWYSCR